MRWVRPLLTISANSPALRSREASRCCSAGMSVATIARVVAMWIADGKTSLEDCEAFTWSFGCTGLPSPSVASVAMTSLVFMLLDVPEPVWKTSMGKWSSQSPRATAAAASAMAAAASASRTPRSALTVAAAPLIAASAPMSSRSMGVPERGKFSTARGVWARHLAHSGTRTSPMESCSMRYPVASWPMPYCCGATLHSRVVWMVTSSPTTLDPVPFRRGPFPRAEASGGGRPGTVTSAPAASSIRRVVSREECPHVSAAVPTAGRRRPRERAAGAAGKVAPARWRRRADPGAPPSAGCPGIRGAAGPDATVRPSALRPATVRPPALRPAAVRPSALRPSALRSSALRPPGQPPYGPPGQPWGPPGGPGAPPPKSTNSRLIALVVAGVVLLAAAGVGLWLVVRDAGDSTTAAGSSTSARTDPSSSSSGSSSPSSSESSGPSSSPSSGRSTSAPPNGREIPPATVPPQGLGNDPQLDQYAQTCHDGDMAACDTLFKQSEAASRYQAYGDSCAGRRPLGTDVSCTVSFPAE